MAKLKIKNFGPIQDGLTENDGWIEFKKITLFIGNQSTGKSTIAKLYSIFQWLEKDLFRSNDLLSDIYKIDFNGHHLPYHNIANYVQSDTDIEYIGELYHFQYKNRDLKLVNRYIDYGYNVSKIMYIPAERNFLTAIQDAAKVENLPRALSEFMMDYRDALRKIKLGDRLNLPVNNMQVEYDDKTDVTYIRHNSNTNNDSHPIKLLEGSSGIQSLVPLYVASYSQVQDILNNHAKRRNTITHSNELRFEGGLSAIDQEIINLNVSQQRETIKNKLEKLKHEQAVLQVKLKKISEISENKPAKYDKNQRVEMISILEKFVETSESINKFENEIKLIEEQETKKFINYRLINIVEEPEQNLFPTSQKAILYKLIEFVNQKFDDKEIGNQLVITTHSPYLISYLNLLIQAKYLLKICEETKKSNDIKTRVINKIDSLLNINALISGEDVAIYHCENGIVTPLEKLDELITDDNALNNLLDVSNSEFIELLKIEDYLKNAK